MTQAFFKQTYEHSQLYLRDRKITHAILKHVVDVGLMRESL